MKRNVKKMKYAGLITCYISAEAIIEPIAPAVIAKDVGTSALHLHT